MSIFYLAVLFLLFIIMLIFTAVLRVVFFMDTERENICLTLLWLYPFMRINIESKASSPIVSIHFFNRKVYRKPVRLKKAGPRRSMDLFRSVKPERLELDVKYGFSDPFSTGIVCGAINAASSLAKQAYIRQQPDFITNRDFIRMSATANVNIGNTFINFARLKGKNKS